MKKIGLTVLTAVLGLALLAPMAQAAEKKAKEKKASKKPAAEAPAVAQVTHCELAELLVQVLGLARFLPAAPSCQQCFAALLDNSISPFKGWEVGKVVTKADLARVIVQALKKQGEIENPDDPKEWIDYLKSLGVPIDSVGEAVSHLEPLPEAVATHIASASVDPLVKRHKFNPVDETQYGVDMESMVRLFSQFEFDQGEFRPLTPD
ncbi:MAG: hypothetical protein KKC51_03395 [Verrucomicrobia bacterium]|nr:hypothetical protein [Verrucomicrobiota bacterium]